MKALLNAAVFLYWISNLLDHEADHEVNFEYCLGYFTHSLPWPGFSTLVLFESPEFQNRAAYYLKSKMKLVKHR